MTPIFASLILMNWRRFEHPGSYEKSAVLVVDRGRLVCVVRMLYILCCGRLYGLLLPGFGGHACMHFSSNLLIADMRLGESMFGESTRRRPATWITISRDVRSWAFDVVVVRFLCDDLSTLLDWAVASGHLVAICFSRRIVWIKLRNNHR